MFEAVEKATKHNRQMGTFHGDSSDGLLRRITAGQIRAMRARLFEGGVQGLELWTPDLTSLGTTKRQPNMQAVGVSVSSGPKIRYDREAFVRLLRDRAPELDREAWLERIVASRQFEDDAEQLYLDCWQALNDRATRQGRNLERLLGEGNGKA
jgi:hypothetical protein